MDLRIKFLSILTIGTSVMLSGFIGCSKNKERSIKKDQIKMNIVRRTTIDSLGAGQGASYINSTVYLYGDTKKSGVIRAYHLDKGRDSLIYTNKEYRLTVKGKSFIHHPTGLAVHPGLPTFLGNTIRLNEAGTRWKAVIDCIDWEGLMKTGTLDGNVINVIEDDAAIQGTRPHYVQYHNKWYVATADYGNHGNEVRLYDPVALSKAQKTSDAGVLYEKFSCSPWVQNLSYLPKKDLLVLIQNQIEGRKWRFTYVNLAKSVESGKSVVVGIVNINIPNELEGFTFIGSRFEGIAVTSSREDNVSCMGITW